MSQHSTRKHLGIPGPSRQGEITSILADGFPFSRKLVGHTSCVNALTFSSRDGRFLASGGDDMQISIWDFHQEDIKTRTCSFRGPRGNVFSLAFSATNRYLYSGGTDETILQYDVSHFSSSFDTTYVRSPDQIFRYHEDIIRGISCHPYQEDIFLSASQDGRILRHDRRANSHSVRAQDTIQIPAEVTGVQFHPIMEHIFVSSDGRGIVALRDARMGFGPLIHRTRQGVVHMYNTKLTRRSMKQLSNPEASSVTFDRDGSKLAVTMLQFLPTIYALSDPHPLAVCSGKNLPGVLPTERTYANSCTIKHGSFGGPGLDSDDYYSAGSEDFCAYIWKIPKLSELAERREQVEPEKWEAQQWPNTVAFSERLNSPKYIPVELETPTCRLKGHNSIVNSTLFHPHLLHVVTSGIEKYVLLHSPTSSSPCSKDMQLTPTEVRRLASEDEEDRNVYLRALAGLHEPHSPGGERTAIRMFDHIIREEGQVDIFTARRWVSHSSDEEDTDDDDIEIDIEDY